MSELEPTTEQRTVVRGRAAPPVDPGTGWPEENAPDSTERLRLVEDDRGGRWGRRLLFLIGTVGVIAALVLGLKSVDLWPDFKNPFRTETTDRSQPVLLLSIQDLSRYTAAEGNFQVLVDVQRNNRFVPDFLYNERWLFVGAGTVEAYVDFSTLSEDAIKTSEDGKSVTITLPAPQLSKPNLDNSRSYVYAQEEGFANRVKDFFSNDPNEQQKLYQQAEQKIAEAATASELRQRAENNTRHMLESMMKSLGYETVTVVFVQS
jgi:hypothetical protein